MPSIVLPLRVLQLAVLSAALAGSAAWAQVTPPSPASPTAPPSAMPDSPSQPGLTPPPPPPPPSMQRPAPAVQPRAPMHPGAKPSSPAVSRQGDPKQWQTEDKTRADHFRTAKKEVGAGYQESLNDCKTQPKAARSACMRDAKQTYTSELAKVQAEYGQK
jgi:hypothetical protein